MRALIDAIRTGGPTPIPLSEAVATTLTTLRILDSLRLGEEVTVEWSAEPVNSAASSSPGGAESLVAEAAD